MTVNLPTNEDLKYLTKPWPLKDAQPVWQSIYELSIKDFIKLAPLLEYPGSLLKAGRPSKLEKLARLILFEMSDGQRNVAYKIITKKAAAIKII